jgi:hypothetical protein
MLPDLKADTEVVSPAEIDRLCEIESLKLIGLNQQFRAVNVVTVDDMRLSRSRRFEHCRPRANTTTDIKHRIGWQQPLNERNHSHRSLSRLLGLKNEKRVVIAHARKRTQLPLLGERRNPA